MIVLAASGTLAAGASSASKLTCTVFGMTLNAGVETYSILDQRQLANSPATIYTVASSTQCFIKSISVINTDLFTSYTFQFFSGGTAAANAITPVYSIPPGGGAFYEDGKGWQIINKVGQKLESSFASEYEPQSNIRFHASKGETMPRQLCPEVNTAFAASGTLFMQAIFLQGGVIVNNIVLYSATTASATLTYCLFGLYDSSRNLLATSANASALGTWAANTSRSLPMVTPYTIPTTGLYYIGVFVTATTMPTLKGFTARTDGSLNGTAPIISGTADTGLTALPNPASAITPTNNSIWACVT